MKQRWGIMAEAMRRAGLVPPPAPPPTAPTKPRLDPKTARKLDEEAERICAKWGVDVKEEHDG